MTSRSASAAALAALLLLTGCRRAQTTNEAPRAIVLVTIDTLRADHVGAYGYARARTSSIDAVAKRGIVFDRAYAAAPITLPSHATILSGRYPPGHGARDNGMRMSGSVRTIATELHARGFATGAFVAAFPLDHQFGLDRGFDVYSDRLGRDNDGRPANERPASQVVAEARAWIASNAGRRTFAWVHLFEPHAPYSGDPSRSAIERYDDEIAVADQAIAALAADTSADVLTIVTSDHGEAFGEHGEYAHSIFVYDTTLHVPLVIAGAGLPPPDSASGRHVSDPVSLADIAPTIMRLAGAELKDVDGIDLTSAMRGGAVPSREIYSESFAPLIEFGWAPLRALRSGSWKLVAAPRPELYDLARDPDEQRDLASTDQGNVARLSARIAHYSDAALPPTISLNADAQTADRLRALGYAAGGRGGGTAGGARPDPKDRRELAARIARVTAGELSGDALIAALEAIVRDDPRNGQAHLRLGYARLQRGDCQRAEPELAAAIATGLPSADAHLGLATCLGRRGDLEAAGRALTEAQRLEPSNPVIVANIGILQAARGNLPKAIESFKAALAADPDLTQARFDLAVAYARSGHRGEAVTEARTLLTRLPPNAPQRQAVEQLLRQLQ